MLMSSVSSMIAAMTPDRMDTKRLRFFIVYSFSRGGIHPFQRMYARGLT